MSTFQVQIRGWAFIRAWVFIRTFMVHGDIHVQEVKFILWSLSKVTQNETGSQVRYTEPRVLWFPNSIVTVSEKQLTSDVMLYYLFVKYLSHLILCGNSICANLPCFIAVEDMERYCNLYKTLEKDKTLIQYIHLKIWVCLYCNRHNDYKAAYLTGGYSWHKTFAFPPHEPKTGIFPLKQ